MTMHNSANNYANYLQYAPALLHILLSYNILIVLFVTFKVNEVLLVVIEALLISSYNLHKHASKFDR